MVSSNVFKILTTIAIFFLAIISALLPYKLRANKRVLSVLNIMAGGVFLGAGLCHLLADAADQFADYAEEHDHDDHDHEDEDPTNFKHGSGDEPFPWAYCMAGIGFLSTLAIEQLAHYLMHMPSKETEQDDALINSSDSSSDHYINHDHEHNHHEHNLEEHNHEHDHDHDQEEPGHSHVPINTAGQSFVVVVALWLALAFHSVCEGVAMGAANNDDSTKAIVIAILAHKGLESFSLGTNLIRADASMFKYIMFCFLFACMTPIGVFIGHLVSTTTESLAAAFVSAFAAGTFIYVAVVEVIIPEITKQQDTALKVIAISIGFAIMAVIAIWV